MAEQNGDGIPISGTPLDIHPDGETSGALAGVDPDKIVDVPLKSVIGLTDGTAAGKPSVMIRADLPDGQTVIAQTTLALFLAAADALKARHGDPRE